MAFLVCVANGNQTGKVRPENNGRYQAIAYQKGQEFEYQERMPSDVLATLPWNDLQW